jgi:hypothetical protein
MSQANEIIKEIENIRRSAIMEKADILLISPYIIARKEMAIMYLDSRNIEEKKVAKEHIEYYNTKIKEILGL